MVDLHSTSHRCAFIDIGTNTILCLIAECVDGGGFAVLDDLAEITRLGQGVDRSRRISDAGEERSASILRRYLERCRRLGVQEITAVGTSALRDAENSRAVLQRWQRVLGLTVRVISGAEEAAYSFLAACEGLALSGRELLVIDIGGGSTELIRGNAGAVSDWVSVDLGSVRLTERFLHSDPVCQSECDAMSAAIDAALGPIASRWKTELRELTLVGIAGTFTTLAAVEKQLEKYSHSQVHGSLLSTTEVGRQIELYQRLTIGERKKLPGLDPMRADVILAGAYLIERIMTLLGGQQVIVSDQGVRYGLMYERLGRRKSIDIGP
jgi:exopolyphosphatase/guanosine-5'-triphosphate,3'-diphosphate pyrophosphatase